MRIPPRVGAVGFDIDHTLCIDNKLERVAFLHLLEEIADEAGGAFGSLTDETRGIDDLLAWQRGGGGTIDEAVFRFVAAHGVTPRAEHPERYRARALSLVDTFVIPAPDARATLAALRARAIPHAILSNGWNPLQLRKAQRVGFDGVPLVSADLGVAKPDAHAFAALTNLLGEPSSSTVYVGDDPRADVAGAIAAGLGGVWLDNEGNAYPAMLPPPTHVVHALHDLLTLLPRRDTA